MPKSVSHQRHNYNNYGYQQTQSYTELPVRRSVPVIKKIRKRKKINPFKKFFSSIILLGITVLIGYYVLPFSFDRLSKPLLFGHNYSQIKTDYYELAFPTTNYLSNDLFLNKRTLSVAREKTALMTNLYKTDEMTVLKSGLIDLTQKYPTIEPAIMVWDFDSGKYIDINATKIYPTASIIKIPVLIQLFKSIEAKELTIYDSMMLTNYYKASGSGTLQYEPSGKKYTIDNLAKVMIEDSDNSATNMLIAKMGSMTAVNEALRTWGMKNTHIQTWLPDLQGTNYSTAQDMATMLFNLDNPSFLDISSREYIIDYMSHVKNNHLIPQGLGKGATFIHKTGDIGTMLGDAGIVYMPNGKRYIVVIFAKRPYNSPKGKEFIQMASKMIYDFMSDVY